MYQKILYSLAIISLFACKAQDPIFEEVNGIVAVEAECFYWQESDSIRRWYVISNDNDDQIVADSDTSHAFTASGQQYLELLPDTRITHDDELIRGVNFSNKPGQLAILHYQIYFNTPGKYYVWVRAFSAGAKDNSIHVGIDGNWPSSGERMQWCKGKHQWTWESKQRTLEIHCGVARQIYIDVETVGLHIISFSMREDGFEFDKFVLTQEYKQPTAFGPVSRLK